MIVPFHTHNFELKFAEKVQEIVGVDYYDEVISFLNKKLKEKNIRNVKLYLSDIRKMDKELNLGKFDLVIMVDVIEHIKKDKVALKNVKKMLATNEKQLAHKKNLFIASLHHLWIELRPISNKKLRKQIDNLFKKAKKEEQH